MQRPLTALARRERALHLVSNRSVPRHIGAENILDDHLAELAVLAVGDALQHVRLWVPADVKQLRRVVVLEYLRTASDCSRTPSALDRSLWQLRSTCTHADVVVRHCEAVTVRYEELVCATGVPNICDVRGVSANSRTASSSVAAVVACCCSATHRARQQLAKPQTLPAQSASAADAQHVACCTRPAPHLRRASRCGTARRVTSGGGAQWSA
jgi:hypothetical protein